MRSNQEEATGGGSRLKRTPLFAFHQRKGGRFVDFGGWEMPVQYQSILDEHRAVRTTAGLFDVSHMGEISVTGPEAGGFLDRLVTNAVGSQPVGKAIYSPMCQPDGGTVDDLLIYKRGEADYLLCVNASNIGKDLAWINRHAASFECEVQDLSDSYGLLALQGPASEEILRPLASIAPAGITYYTFTDGRVADIPCTISRTGYTGEDGFELFVPAEKAEALAEALMEAGSAKGLVPAGLGARDSLRLEAGFALYGHELSETISPIQARLGWTVRFEKEVSFLGCEALREQKKNGPDSRVVYFRTRGRRIIRPGSRLFSPEGEAGEVLSGTLSPTLNEAIGTALIPATAVGRQLHAEIRGQHQEVEIVKPPFYKRT